MGIFSKEKIKSKLCNLAVNAAKQGAELVSSTSYLTQEQVEFIDAKRSDYLNEMPSPDSKGSQEKIRRNLGAMGVEIFQSYLPRISSLYLPVSSEVRFNPYNSIRYFNITKWVNDSEENSIEKLMNVYQVLNEEDCNIALIYNRKKEGCEVSLAVVDNSFSSEPTRINTYNERLRSAVKGNFPGTEISSLSRTGTGLPECLKHIDSCTVAAVSNLAAEKSQNFISQSMEKLLDGIIPKTTKSEYTIILLATPVVDQEKRKLRLCELYTQLAPYSNWSTNYTYSDSNTVNSQSSVDVNVGSSIGAQAQTGASFNASAKANAGAKASADAKAEAKASADAKTGISAGGSKDGKEGSGNPLSGSMSFSYKPNDPLFRKVADKVEIGVKLSNDTGSLLPSANAGANAGANVNANAGANANANADAGAEAVGGAKAEADAHAGINFGMDYAHSSHITATVGKNEGITQNFVNYNVMHTLENLESQMKRIEQSTAMGMWDFAAYILSEDAITVNNVAHTYLALTQGDDSYMSQSAINIWHRNYGYSQRMQSENEQAKHILGYLSRLQHPVFALKYKSGDWAMYPSVVTATTSLSGKELAYSLNFPRKSVSGFPVLECAPFGRNIISYQKLEKNLRLGTIYHMHRAENDSEVLIDKESLISHMLVTGSIGSGKTNTVSRILQRVSDNSDIKFMVIEPAKGEYRNIFGGRKDVSVYGTNLKITELLRINPFSFPEKISVSEHIDRLIGIFSICLPMTPAMPSILKEAISNAYEKVGWDIAYSENKYSDLIFPEFSDLLDEIKQLMKQSEYSAECRSDCFGVLVSYIKILSSGLNAKIFSPNELSNSQLFDENVIVDLSRLGSSETKSFIMGLLVMKLEEHRIANKVPGNRKVEHLTVLEEAHDLLRRTSSVKESRIHYLFGKSVENLSDSISELRAFGEGFIIVDQAPELLDTAIIRNTATKIIHRLPELSDRELVGKAIGLNSNQINELSKLDVGVAAVYQNDWIEPILCRVDEFDNEQKKVYIRSVRKDTADEDYKKLRDKLLYTFLANDCSPGELGIDLQELLYNILHSGVKPAIKYDFFQYLTSEESSETDCLTKLVYDFFDIEEAVKIVEKTTVRTNPQEWIYKISKTIGITEQIYGTAIYNKVMACVLMEQVNRNQSYDIVLKYFADNN